MDEPGSFSGRDNNVFFLQNVQMALQPNQPPIQWIPVAFSAVVRRKGYETDCLHHPLLKLRMSGAIFPRPLCLPGVHTKKLYVVTWLVIYRIRPVE